MDKAQVWLYARLHARLHIGRKVIVKKKCFKQLHLVKERKTTNLVHAKRKFNLVIRLIANKYYENTFYFLSFLLTVLRLPFLALHIYLITLY